MAHLLSLNSSSNKKFICPVKVSMSQTLFKNQERLKNKHLRAKSCKSSAGLLRLSPNNSQSPWSPVLKGPTLLQKKCLQPFAKHGFGLNI